MLLLVLSMSLISFTTQASTDAPLFYWDNNEGFVDAKHCEIKPLKETPLRVSQYTGRKNSTTENLRNSNGVRQSHLANGSLVVLIEEKGKPSYSAVKVLGTALVPEDQSKNRWSSERGDIGFLFDQSLRPIESYSFTPLNISSKLLKQDISQSRWQVPVGESYLQVICPEHQKDRNYLVFQITDNANENVIAYTGVHHQESSIFNQVVSTEKNYDEPISEQRVADELIVEFSEQTESTNSQNRLEDLATPNKSQQTQTPATVIKQNSLKQIVCLSGSSLNIRNSTLDEVIFKAYNGDVVVIAQSFENETYTTQIGSEEYEFIKVSFPEKEGEDQRVGYAAKNFISAQSDCPFINPTPIVRGPETTITGLDDPKCCEFPTVRKTTHPFTSGMRMFGARRGGGKRSHAAADLYRYIDEPILSVAPGTVVRDLYFFYQGTYALEVVHSGGFVARYGEITNKSPKGVQKGAALKMGERLGYMGVVNSGCCRPMLHFELFKGSARGSLSQTNPPYNRRSDLMNPTPYLLKWEREKF